MATFKVVLDDAKGTVVDIVANDVAINTEENRDSYFEFENEDVETVAIVPFHNVQYILKQG